MTSNTANLGISYLVPDQAQKHVTVNEALRILDIVVQLAVSSRVETLPPSSPYDGERYIVANGATGLWAGRDVQIACWQDGGWVFSQPNIGWLAWVVDESRAFAFDGSTWIDMASISQNNVPFIGVNSTADTSNRLSVNSAFSLFNHEGNGHQVKINKAVATDTASLLFQTGFDGRAEFGTTGDDNWHVKVSADGISWNDSIIADKDTGVVSFPSGVEGVVLTSSDQIVGGSKTFVGLVNFSSSVNVSANLTVGFNEDIIPDGSGSGQIKIDGVGYVGFVALSADGMRIGNNSAARPFIVSLDERDELTVLSTGYTVSRVGFKVGEDIVWHGGNFDPGLKVDTWDAAFTAPLLLPNYNGSGNLPNYENGTNSGRLAWESSAGQLVVWSGSAWMAVSLAPVI